ncbi:MAG: T9SS type A sorting domain-containing protein [Filimonas sp.]|nr:T9SS type A sorting domain-containing protein [Filimonas sp.]
MQKNLRTTSFILLVPLGLAGITNALQAQSLERTLISTGGKIASAPQVDLNYSIGELAIATLQGTGNTTVICTEGFQQKLQKDVLKTEPRVDWYGVRVDAYPNPVKDYLTVYVYDDNLDDYRVELYDASERLIQQYKLQQNKLVIPVQYLPSGFYWLKFFNTRLQKSGQYKKFKPFKIIKVN